MRVTLDRRANAAYIYLADIESDGVKKSFHIHPINEWGMINLDYDKEGHLIGIEVLGAKTRLKAEFLEQAEIIDK